MLVIKNNQERIVKENSDKNSNNGQTKDEDDDGVAFEVLKYKKSNDKQLSVRFLLNVVLNDSGYFKFETIVRLEQIWIFTEELPESINKDDVEELIRQNAKLILRNPLTKISSLYNLFIVESGMTRKRLIDLTNAIDFKSEE